MFDFDDRSWAESPEGYRALRELPDDPQTGWDVYALQTAINYAAVLDHELEEDGIFGERTSRGVKRYQKAKRLERDGIAGILTQRRLALDVARDVRSGLPGGLLKGLLEHESSFWLGNYTAQYPDGNRDCGVCQRNTKFTDPEDGFHVPESVQAAAHRIDRKFNEYQDYGYVNEHRAWELAAGSWNAPSWTDVLAQGGALGPLSTVHIERYIAAVTAYVRW